MGYHTLRAGGKGLTGRSSEHASTTPRTLDVRIEPSTKWAPVGLLRQGDRVEALEDAVGWRKIEMGEGTAGWVRPSYTELEDTAAYR